MTDNNYPVITEELYAWIIQFKQVLAIKVPFMPPGYAQPAAPYIDLSLGPPALERLSSSENDLPILDSVTLAFELLLKALAAHSLVRVRFGVNELLKDYLRKLFQSIPTSDPGDLTHRYLEIIHQIFEYGRSPSFPFGDSLWSYVSACMESIGLTLADQSQWKALRVLLIEAAAMGRQAARDGLQTAPLQHFLRRLENTCRLRGEEAKSVARLARNLRFNLEV